MVEFGLNSGMNRFGFSKTTTYDLINVYELASDFRNPTQISKDYKKYGQSQLVAMSGSHWARDNAPFCPAQSVNVRPMSDVSQITLDKSEIVI